MADTTDRAAFCGPRSIDVPGGELTGIASACVLCKAVQTVTVMVPDGALLTGGIISVPVLCSTCMGDDR